MILTQVCFFGLVQFGLHLLSVSREIVAFFCHTQVLGLEGDLVFQHVVVAVLEMICLDVSNEVFVYSRSSTRSLSEDVTICCLKRI